MKKSICLLLAFALMLSLCACSGKDGGKEEAEDITLTMPSGFFEEGMTQEELDETAQESGWKSATLNEDGSVTFVVAKEKHEEMLQETRDMIEESIDELVSSGSCPSIISVEANDDYSVFKVTLNAEEVGMAESFSVLSFYMLGGMYQLVNGAEDNNVTVQFVNEATGEVIQEANSSELGGE